MGNIGQSLGNMGACPRAMWACPWLPERGSRGVLLRVVLRLLPRLVATLVPENVPGWVDIKGREVGEAGLGWRLEEGSP